MCEKRELNREKHKIYQKFFKFSHCITVNKKQDKSSKKLTIRRNFYVLSKNNF